MRRSGQNKNKKRPWAEGMRLAADRIGSADGAVRGNLQLGCWVATYGMEFAGEQKDAFGLFIIRVEFNKSEVNKKRSTQKASNDETSKRKNREHVTIMTIDLKNVLRSIYLVHKFRTDPVGTNIRFNV